jgi:hypothetical protein
MNNNVLGENQWEFGLLKNNTQFLQIITEIDVLNNDIFQHMFFYFLKWRHFWSVSLTRSIINDPNYWNYLSNNIKEVSNKQF